MSAHGGVPDLLGAWVLDACDGDETLAVESHLRECESCSAEARRLRGAVGWLGASDVAPVPTRLRQATLAKARERRPPALLPTLVGAYARQVTLLDRVLDGFEPEDWLRLDPRHDDLSGVVVHLTGNDAMLAADLGLPVAAGPAGPGRAVQEVWRDQARILLEGLSGPVELDRQVRLAGRGEPRLRPLREALIQRAFETWTHLDDIGAAVGRPQPTPPPEQVRRIVDLAVALLPEALREQGLSRPGRVGRLVLEGPGGGEWTFPLGPGAGGGAEVEVTVSAEAMEFARLVARRRPPESVRHTVTGDGALGAHLLWVASMLGCD
ncbi:MAG: maleylpyruvate isomerase family mycothiol-dependent enzyme [Candidatus Dormibacteraeota bacterium]|nr:maleylpyruvate isomerase family mycothiol-dependent enzyme [Candidatus Dormibacteraeota bacterium]